MNSEFWKRASVALRLMLVIVLANLSFISTAEVVTLAIGDSLSSSNPYAKVDSARVDMKRVIERISVKDPYKFEMWELMVPVAATTVGVLSFNSKWVKDQNQFVKDGVQKIYRGKYWIDDVAQYSQMGLAYGMKLCGVKSRHSYGEMSIILGTSAIFMASIVNGLKYSTAVMRPDGTRRNSFPSGHTATAFMGAEFLRREYWETSPWIGVGGYVVAAGTGFMRIYNNRHWLTDVLTGAGIGILSVQTAYWLYPSVSKIFYPSRRKRSLDVQLTPYVSSVSNGVACQLTF